MFQRVSLPEFHARYPTYPFLHALHHALRDPAAACFPETLPTAADQSQFFGAACYLMTNLLGWSNPARGLLWYLNRVRDPAGSPLLSLLNELFLPEGRLDVLSAYFFSRQSLPQWTFFERMATLADRRLCPPVACAPNKDWWDAFDRSDAQVPADSFEGMFDYVDVCWFEPVGASNRLTLSNASNGLRRATLNLPLFQSWSISLDQAAASLGALGWAIDVVTPDLGLLGTFQRSPVTGLWFQGRHDVHLEGNFHPDARQFGDPESELSNGSGRIKVYAGEVLAFMQKKEIKPAKPDDHLNFPFRVGETRRSSQGHLRTIRAHGYDGKGLPIYVVLDPATNTFSAKPACLAHVEYRGVISFSVDCGPYSP